MTGSTSPVTRSHRQQVHDYRPREHLIAFVEIAFISILLRLLLEGDLEPFDMGSI
jgi:hypothetical protein